MSKYQLTESNIYYEGTDVPINKVNIKDSDTIHFVEEKLLKDAYTFFLSELEEEILFDELYFAELHRSTFESLYSWAGKYRNFNMAKGESRFCQGEFISSSLKKIFEELALDNYLKDYKEVSLEKFAEKLAYYKSELITIHPFYEINGRITRLFFDLIAVYNGYKVIDYTPYSSEQYIDASIQCVQFADSSKMERIILDGLQKK